MKAEKNHIYLSAKERNENCCFPYNSKNKLIEQKVVTFENRNMEK